MVTTALIFAVAAITAAGIVATRSGVHAALVSEGTAVGLNDDDTAAEERVTRRMTDWQLTSVSDLNAAEDLLDCLEAHGFTERELVVTGNATFAVRWR